MSRIYEVVGHVTGKYDSRRAPRAQAEELLDALREEAVIIRLIEPVGFLIAFPSHGDHRTYSSRVFEQVGGISRQGAFTGSLAMALNEGCIAVEREEGRTMIARPVADIEAEEEGQEGAEA